MQEKKVDEVVKLNKKDAEGIAVHKFWHTCPICRYHFIEEGAFYCGGCGVRVGF